jgi:epoxyqueuosine reductase
MSLAHAVKSEAHHLGFELVGVTTPDPLPHLDVFERWLRVGRHAEMAYLNTERSRELRADPLKILPQCRTILVLGMRYDSPELADVSQGELAGRIASYAWGADYHDVLPQRMRLLVSFIEARVGHPVPNRWYTDTGPILERELAQRAGLGWIGKNTCLIHPRMGSYFLLAEILLGVELEPDEAITADHCGTCTRCLQACPTGCILPDRTIDAARCISYLTIELKGPIPADLRPQIGNWVFGCDVCQQVCPWNQRFAQAHGDAAFSTHPGIPQPELVEELSLSPPEFNQKFKGNPVKRAKRRGYLRNITVALGNALPRGDHEQSVAALSLALMQDDEPLVRGHAAWALRQVGGERVTRLLQLAFQEEEEPWVRNEISKALSHIHA